MIAVGRIASIVTPKFSSKTRVQVTYLHEPPAEIIPPDRIDEFARQCRRNLEGILNGSTPSTTMITLPDSASPASIRDAWRALDPHYKAGKHISVKVKMPDTPGGNPELMVYSGLDHRQLEKDPDQALKASEDALAKVDFQNAAFSTPLYCPVTIEPGRAN